MENVQNIMQPKLEHSKNVSVVKITDKYGVTEYAIRRLDNSFHFYELGAYGGERGFHLPDVLFDELLKLRK